MGGAITTPWTACLPVYHGAIATLFRAIPASPARCNHHPFYPPHCHPKHGAIATLFRERLASVDKKVIPVQSPPGCGAITTPKDGAITTRKDGAITTPLKPV